MNENENELIKRTFEQLNKKGILNHFQARFISLVTQEVEKSDINCLKPYRNLYDSVADEVASQIVIQFLLRNNLDLTLDTANYEFPDFFKIRDLSILSTLKIKDEDFSASTSNTLHSLLKCWNETKDTLVKSNKQKLRQEIKEKLDYIQMIDEQKQTSLINESDINMNNKLLACSNAHISFDDEDDFDAQISRQLASLTKNTENKVSPLKAQPTDDDIEIITSNINQNIQQKSIDESSILYSGSPINNQKKELKNFFKKDNNSKRKKREVVTLIPMRSADLKGYDDTKTAFITKIQKFDCLESSSSDDFFNSDVSKQDSIKFDIDLDDQYNRQSTYYKLDKKKKGKETETDSDDFDDLLK